VGVLPELGVVLVRFGETAHEQQDHPVAVLVLGDTRGQALELGVLVHTHSASREPDRHGAGS
jgi:hypothetical protein